LILLHIFVLVTRKVHVILFAVEQHHTQAILDLVLKRLKTENNNKIILIKAQSPATQHQ
jgi:hypothetical protein